ncbi:MAG: cation diffusion facilitator family transporter [Chitinophagaceae bacterium]
MEHGHTHGHSQGHSHSHIVSAAVASSRAFIMGIGLNLVYVFAEFFAGLWTHSLALLTDAGHNLSDVASLALSLMALRLARVKPTHTYTYGYKKSTILAALINAVVLFIAIGVLGFEAFERLGNPQPIEGGIVAWVAGIGIIVNGVSAFLFFKEKDELNAKSAYLHLLGDMLVSVGVVIAGIVIHFTNWYWLDTIVSLGVLVVILISTWSLLTDSFRLSMDAVPKDIDLEKVQKVMEMVAGVKAVMHVHIWAISTTENALTAHVSIEDEKNRAALLSTLKHDLQHCNIQHATIEINESGLEETQGCDIHS